MREVRWTQSSMVPLTVPSELKGLLSIVRKEQPELEIVIKPVYPKRTAEQNAMFHAKLGELAAETGANKEWLKEEIKKLACTHGYPFEVIDDESIPISTSRANIEQMEMLIDSLYEYAFEHGIYLEENK